MAYGSPWYWHMVWHSQPCPNGCKSGCRKGFGREDPATCPQLSCSTIDRGPYLMKANPLIKSRPSWKQRLWAKRRPYPFITDEFGPFVDEIAKTEVRQHQELADLRHRPKRSLLDRILVSLGGFDEDTYLHPLRDRMPASWPDSRCNSQLESECDSDFDWSWAWTPSATPNGRAAPSSPSRCRRVRHRVRRRRRRSPRVRSYRRLPLQR